MSDAVVVAIISGSVSLIINIGTKWLDHKSGLAKDIKEIKEDVKHLKKKSTMNSDMIYQILDHLSSHNNTGEMKRALNEYNAYFRQTD